MNFCWIHWKEFRKFLIVNFRLLKKNSKFFTADSLKKIFEKILQSISLKKNFKHFLLMNSLKKISKNFYCWFHWKKIPKFLIVDFRLLKNFLLLNSLKKQFRKFLQSISLKKYFEIFSENPKKNFLPPKKRGSQGGVKIRTIFPGKSDTTFR